MLTRVLGDIGLAEDVLSEAFTAALQQWPTKGPPPSPAGWILTTARNRAIDHLRRESARAGKQAAAALLHVERNRWRTAGCGTTNCGCCSPARHRWP